MSYRRSGRKRIYKIKVKKRRLKKRQHITPKLKKNSGVNMTKVSHRETHESFTKKKESVKADSYQERWIGKNMAVRHEVSHHETLHESKNISQHEPERNRPGRYRRKTINKPKIDNKSDKRTEDRVFGREAGRKGVNVREIRRKENYQEKPRKSVYRYGSYIHKNDKGGTNTVNTGTKRWHGKSLKKYTAAAAKRVYETEKELVTSATELNKNDDDRQRAVEQGMNDVITKSIRRESGDVLLIGGQIVKQAVKTVAAAAGFIINTAVGLIISVAPVIMVCAVVIFLIVCMFWGTSEAVMRSPLRVAYLDGNTTDTIEEYISDKIDDFWDEVNKKEEESTSDSTLILINNGEGDAGNNNNYYDILAAYVSAFIDENYSYSGKEDENIYKAFGITGTGETEENPDNERKDYYSVCELTSKNKANADRIIKEMLNYNVNTYKYHSYGSNSWETLTVIDVSVHRYECFEKTWGSTTKQARNGRSLQALYDNITIRDRYAMSETQAEAVRLAIERSEGELHDLLVGLTAKIGVDKVICDPDFKSTKSCSSLAAFSADVLKNYKNVKVSSTSLDEQVAELRIRNLTAKGNALEIGDLAYYRVTEGRYSYITECYLYIGNGFGICASSYYGTLVVKEMPKESPYIVVHTVE